MTAAAQTMGRARNAEPVVVVPVPGVVPVAVGRTEVPGVVDPGTAPQHAPTGRRSGPRDRLSARREPPVPEDCAAQPPRVGVLRVRHPGAYPLLHRVLMTAVLLLPVLAADTHPQVLLEIDGVELHGRAWRVMPGTGTCNVLETDTSYETKKDNHGATMDVWRLDFSVRNGSGRWLDHLIARYEVESEWPDCTNWSGPDDAQFFELNSDVPLHELTVGWSGTIGSIQESGRNVVQPGRTLTTTEFIIVLSGDPKARLAVLPGSAGIRPDTGEVVDFGDDAGVYARDGECNDPRFEGPGAVFVFDSHRGHDATDCRELFESGRISLRNADMAAASGTPAIDFGDDTGGWAQDGECDDPRRVPEWVSRTVRANVVVTQRIVGSCTSKVGSV